MRRARSWPPIFSGIVIWPDWECRSARRLDASPDARPRAMRSTDAVEAARRGMEICQACRYCEGYCVVFQVMDLRRAVTDRDLGYLANLCHNCRNCYYACQYAPPHEFAINLPKSFSEIRGESYEHYAWPRPLGRLFRRNGLFVSVAVTMAIAIALIATAALHSPAERLNA